MRIGKRLGPVVLAKRRELVNGLNETANLVVINETSEWLEEVDPFWFQVGGNDVGEDVEAPLDAKRDSNARFDNSANDNARSDNARSDIFQAVNYPYDGLLRPSIPTYYGFGKPSHRPKHNTFVSTAPPWLTTAFCQDAERNSFIQNTIDAAQPRMVKVYGAGAGRVEGFATGILISNDGKILTSQGVFS